MIQKFDGDFPVSHLRFTIDYNAISDTEKGSAHAPINYIIYITLNGNPTKRASFQARPDLLLAKTIIHEVIHAEMWRKLASLIRKGTITELTLENINEKLLKHNYPGIFNYYKQYTIFGFQHPQMVDYYRNFIADVLQAFDNHQHSRQFYGDISWEGLRYENIPEWHNLSQIEKDRINKVINDFIDQYQEEND